MDAFNISSIAQLQNDLVRQPALSAAQLPPPPPELVRQFEALMARTPPPQVDSIADSPLTHAAVASVEGHLQHHAAAVDRVMAMNSGDMSLAEMQTLQAQSTLELGLISMNQAAYMQVLGSTKSTVSALMKNQ